MNVALPCAHQVFLLPSLSSQYLAVQRVSQLRSAAKPDDHFPLPCEQPHALNGAQYRAPLRRVLAPVCAFLAALQVRSRA